MSWAIGLAFVLSGCGNGIAGVPAAAAQRTAEGAANGVGTLAFPALTRIYRFTGLVTTSRAATGVQVSAHCTNWKASNLSIQFVVREFNGVTVATAGPFVLTPLRSFTYVTQHTELFFNDAISVPTVVLHQGSLEILATGPEVHCSAQLVDATSTSASSVVTLAGTRSNQEDGSQE